MFVRRQLGPWTCSFWLCIKGACRRVYSSGLRGCPEFKGLWSSCGWGWECKHLPKAEHTQGCWAPRAAVSQVDVTWGSWRRADLGEWGGSQCPARVHLGEFPSVQLESLPADWNPFWQTGIPDAPSALPAPAAGKQSGAAVSWYPAIPFQPANERANVWICARADEQLGREL